MRTCWRRPARPPQTEGLPHDWRNSTTELLLLLLLILYVLVLEHRVARYAHRQGQRSHLQTGPVALQWRHFDADGRRRLDPRKHRLPRWLAGERVARLIAEHAASEAIGQHERSWTRLDGTARCSAKWSNRRRPDVEIFVDDQPHTHAVLAGNHPISQQPCIAEIGRASCRERGQ